MRIDAAVLIDGKLKHVWPKDELQRLRTARADFEAALAAAIDGELPGQRRYADQIAR